MDKRYYLDCICDCNEHVVRISYLDDEMCDDDSNIYLSVQLNPTKNFFERIKSAINYILYNSCPTYGHWDCVCIKFSDLDIIENLINISRENRKKRDQKEGNL